MKVRKVEDLEGACRLVPVTFFPDGKKILCAKRLGILFLMAANGR